MIDFASPCAGVIGQNQFTIRLGNCVQSIVKLFEHVSQMFIVAICR